MPISTEELERLYRSDYVRFRNVLATVTGSPEAAHDVVQEAFARALSNKETYRGEGSLRAWVWRIALRAALETRGRASVLPLDVALEPSLVEPARDPELAAAVRRLPPRRRLIVFLRFFADLSYAEIATACGISEGTVAAAIAQARTELASSLTRLTDSISTSRPGHAARRTSRE